MRPRMCKGPRYFGWVSLRRLRYVRLEYEYGMLLNWLFLQDVESFVRTWIAEFSSICLQSLRSQSSSIKWFNFHFVYSSQERRIYLPMLSFEYYFWNGFLVKIFVFQYATMCEVINYEIHEGCEVNYSCQGHKVRTLKLILLINTIHR